MKEYVVSFLFTPDYKNVWLVKKEKPEWQKGSLNGIGGKIELKEMPSIAAIRELKEETGIELDQSQIKYMGNIEGIDNDSSDFKVFIFTGVTDLTLKTMESEEIKLVPIEEVKFYKHIENVPLLIESCLYYLRGKSNFKELKMIY